MLTASVAFYSDEVSGQMEYFTASNFITYRPTDHKEIQWKSFDLTGSG
jgi:hypothetical protein